MLNVWARKKFSVWGTVVLLSLSAGVMPLSADSNETAVGGPNAVAQSSISLGEGYTCVVTSGGAVKCWGNNNNGQLGNGSTIASGTSVDVQGLGSGITAISSGAQHVCALSSGGAVKCWGGNVEGQLGNNSLTDSNVPVDVQGLGSGVVAIAAGDLHSCALTSGGAVKCWGYNSDGQLGNNSFTKSKVPVDVQGLSSGVTAITGGTGHSCALTSGGAVKCWGGGSLGQLGQGSFGTSPVPVNVQGLSSGVTVIAAGNFHSCAVTSAGAAKCWGRNFFGQLGIPGGSDSNVPVDVQDLGSGVAAITGGANFSCALTSAGAAKCWGRNTVGQLGYNQIPSSTAPVDVYGMNSGVIAISSGLDHTCAVMASGAVKCWGSNVARELGDNSTTNRIAPVDVQGLGVGVGVTTTTTSTTVAATTTTVAPTITSTTTATSASVVSATTTTSAVQASARSSESMPATGSASSLPSTGSGLAGLLVGLFGLILTAAGGAMTFTRRRRYW